MADEYPYAPLGYVLHKVARRTESTDMPFVIADTLFFPYEQLPWHLTVKDPRGNGNILAEFANDYDNGNCHLTIRHFDDDLVFDTTEIVVPFANFIGSSGDPGLLLDPTGNIVLFYYDHNSSPLEYSFAKVGLDGTVKLQMSNDSLRIEPELTKSLMVFSESPLTYCFCGTYHVQVKANTPYRDYVNCYLLDSLFNVTNLYTLPRRSSSPENVDYSNDSYYTKVLGLEDGCFLVARPYNRDYNLIPHIEDNGVAVIKYDSSFNLLTQKKFLSEPYYQNSNFGAHPIGLERSEDGCIYFAYFTHKRFKQSQVSVVKMDSDLNILWQRHCLEREYGRDFGMMIVLEDNSVAVMGINTYDETGYFDHTDAFYIIVNDDYDGMEEQGFIVRPYAYYPNPVQDELRLQFSPDVTPTQIELYDLQGRLVRMQKNSLERLEMSGLPSGTYTMRVMLEDGKVFSDKVVKE